MCVCVSVSECLSVGVFESRSVREFACIIGHEEKAVTMTVLEWRIKQVCYNGCVNPWRRVNGGRNL